MKLLVLNLRRATKRRAFMQRQLDSLGLDYEFVEGTDYRDMTEKDFLANCEEQVLRGDNYLKGVFAASLSHIKIYKTLIAQNLDCALVCEDDALFPSNIASLLDDVATLIREDEIVLLSYYSHTSDPLSLTERDSVRLADGMRLLAPDRIRPVASAMAYVIPRQVAAAMVERLVPVGHVPDDWARFYEKGAFKRLRFLYPHVMSDAHFEAIVEYPASRTLRFKLKSAIRALPLVRTIEARLAQHRPNPKYRFNLVDRPPFWVDDDPLRERSGRPEATNHP